MTKPRQVITVEASDHGNVDGKRTISVEIKVKPELFLLPDMLVNEGVLVGIESDLKKLARTAVIAHIEASRTLLKSLAERKRTNGEAAE